MTLWDDEAGKGDWREEVVSQFSTGWFENRASLGGWRMSQVAIAGMGSRQGSRRAKVEVGLRVTWVQPRAWSRHWLFSPPGIRPLEDRHRGLAHQDSQDWHMSDEFISGHIVDQRKPRPGTE